MSVVIEDIRIKPTQYTTNTVETNYLLGNIGDKVTIEVDFRAEEIFVTENDVDVDRILLAPQPFRVNVANSKDVIFSDLSGVFENYRIGDTLSFYNDTTTSTFSYEVYEVLSNQAIRVHTVGGSAGDVDFYAANGNSYDTSLPINSYIYITTDLTSINYRWNFVENQSGNNFIDAIGKELNQAKASGVDNTDLVTVLPMIFDVPVTNNYGTISVKGNGSTTTSQRFTLTHETIITPFFLAGQEEDLENGVAPSYLKAAKSLKYITSIDVGRTANDPNFIQTVGFNALDGNVGFYDENFNGNNSAYSVESVAYKNAALETITSVELIEGDQTIDLVVKSDNGTFADNLTEFTLNFCILPTDVEDHRNNGKTIIQNFYFDTAFNTVGSVASNGDNFGTDYQVLKEVSATFTNANTINVSAVVNLSANAVSDLNSKGFNYLIWVDTQDYTKETEDTDRVAIKADIKPFYLDLSDDGMVGIEHNFLRHYESDPTTEGTTTPIVRIEDDVLTYSTITIDRNGRETDEILITSITNELIAKKIDGSEFSLESFTQGFSGAQIIGDTQFIDVSSERSFKMPDGDLRKTIKTFRRSDLDTVDLRYYESWYPFLMNWAYWTAKSGVDGDAFDISLPNNGQNEDWQRYDTIVDWDIYFRTTVIATKNGTSLTYQKDSILQTADYEEDGDWINEGIVALNADTDAPIGTLLVNPTKIVASKTYNGTGSPTVSEVEWVMRIEVYEDGGISDIRYLSSVYDWTQYSWFNSTDTSNKVVKSIDTGVYKAEALINFDDLPENTQFKVSARIYDETALGDCCLLTEDSVEIFAEDNVNCISPESC